MSNKIDAIKARLGLSKKNADLDSAFAAKLLAKVEGFDFAAALEAKNEEALAEHWNGIIAERDEAKTQLTEQNKDLDEIYGALEIAKPTKTPEGKKPDLKQTVKAATDKKVIKKVSEAGVQVDDIPGDKNDPDGSAYETWKAMESGAKKNKFYAENKEEIFESGQV